MLPLCVICRTSPLLALYCIIVRMREFDTKFLAGILILVNNIGKHGYRIMSEDKTVEFGLKISFSPCLPILEYQQEIVYRTLALEQLCSTGQKYSSGEVRQITHKGSIQLTILRS